MIEFFVVGKLLKTSSFPIMWWNIAPELLGGHLHFGELFFPSVTWISLFACVFIFGNLVLDFCFEIFKIFMWVLWSTKSFSIVYCMRFNAVICNTKLGSTLFLNSMMMLPLFKLKIFYALLSFLFFSPLSTKIICWNHTAVPFRSHRVCLFIGSSWIGFSIALRILALTSSSVVKLLSYFWVFVLHIRVSALTKSRVVLLLHIRVSRTFSSRFIQLLCATLVSIRTTAILAAALGIFRFNMITLVIIHHFSILIHFSFLFRVLLLFLDVFRIGIIQLLLVLLAS